MSSAATSSTPAATMHFWDAYWDLRIAECPCDVHFMSWLDANGITDKAIYHFGSGGHHHVGIECAAPQRRNAVLAITAAPQEHETYLKLAIERPDVLRHYNCVFGDIYLINPKLLPRFDVVTLFHLCEFRDERNDAYGALTDLEVAEILTDKTEVGGYILFYTKSFAFEPARDVIAAWEKSRKVEKVGMFETLLVYRRVG